MGQDPSNIRVKGPLVYIRANTGEWFYYDTREKPLGNGAMGTVYFGRSYSNHHKMVAIKRVSDQLVENPRVRQRAKDESAFAFRHQNMVEMIGYCENHPDKGPIFIISNLVQGVTLDKHVAMTLNRMPDRVNRIMRCAIPVLNALEYLHGKSILHMDIKPTNIMVENGSNIRLMDLGIACVSSVLDTDKGGLLGTPGYAAPEQYVVKGQTDLDISKATDIYELGATMYDLLSGRKPYSDNKDKLTPIKDVPPKMMAVLKKALAQKQGDRYQSASEFRQAIQEAMRDGGGGNNNLWVILGVSVTVLIILFLFMLL